MKKIGVLFSGGLDSTYLVWKNLNDGNQVIPIYVEIENNGNKSILEKNRIKLLYEKFAKEFNNDDNTYIHNINYAISVGVHAREDSLHLKQIPVWIFSLMFMQSMDIDEIQIGYIMNDDAISYLDDIQTIYKSYQPICEPMKPLFFPLTKKKKWEIVRKLPKEYLELIVSCENPRIISDENVKFVEYEPCCNCTPCNSIINSNYYELDKFPENYHRQLVERHAYDLRKFKYKVVDDNGVEYFEKMCKLEPSKIPHQLSLDFDYEIEDKMEYESVKG